MIIKFGNSNQQNINTLEPDLKYIKAKDQALLASVGTGVVLLAVDAVYLKNKAKDEFAESIKKNNAGKEAEKEIISKIKKGKIKEFGFVAALIGALSVIDYKIFLNRQLKRNQSDSQS